MRSAINVYLLVLILSLAGCAVTAPPMPTIGVGYTEAEVRDLVEAVVLILHQHDFVITLANSEIGLITTDWRIISTELSETVGLIIADDPMKMRMQLSIMVDKTSKKVKIKPSKQTHSTIRGWSYSELYESDKLILQDIAQGIAERIGSSPNDVTWQGPVSRPEPKKPPVVSDNELKLFGAAVIGMGIAVWFVFFREEQ